ncbi:hypothetical protein HDU96_004337 [Phlyctochytrium bullatum]|nr:hypothetical protein HDU96_004337 [Phlyctochytrium bullatum]
MATRIGSFSDSIPSTAGLTPGAPGTTTTAPTPTPPLPTGTLSAFSTFLPQSVEALQRLPPILDLANLLDDELQGKGFSERTELPKVHPALEDLRTLYLDSFSRLREEVDLLSLRAERLRRLGVNPRAAAVASLKAEVRALKESFPFRELTVAVLGPSGVGKSTLLNRFVGRREIFGKGSTRANFAFMHAKNSRMHPLVSKRDNLLGTTITAGTATLAAAAASSVPATPSTTPPNAVVDLILVSHELESLKHVTFFDTVASDAAPPAQGTITFSGIDMDDPAILSVSVSGARVATVQQRQAVGAGGLDDTPVVITEPASSAAAKTAAANAANAGSLPSPLLETAEGVDVVIFVVSPSNLAQVPRSLILKSLGAATVPILVVNKMDSVWDVIHAKGGDAALVSGYESWKTNANTMVRNQISVPGLLQFYISAVRDSPLSDLDDLDATLQHLVERRRSIKALTAACRLHHLAASYDAVVSSHCQHLDQAAAFLQSISAVVDAARARAVGGGGAAFEGTLSGAVAAAVWEALEDVGLVGAEGVFEEGALSQHPYVKAVRLEMGVDVLEEVATKKKDAGVKIRVEDADAAPASVTANHADTKDEFQLPSAFDVAAEPAATPPATEAAAAAAAPAAPAEEEEDEDDDDEEELVRDRVVELLKQAANGNDELAGRAALRLSHLFRPTALDGVRWDGRAREWLQYLRLAAAKDCVKAQIELGRFLETGVLPGPPPPPPGAGQEAGAAPAAGGAQPAPASDKDGAAAMRWYLKAAEKNHPQACLELARCYLEGVGNTAPNATVAVHWLRKAVAESAKGVPWSGAGEAALELARCVEEGLGAVKSQQEAAAWKAEAGNHARAFFGVVLENVVELIATERRPRSSYGLHCFVDRLFGQLHQHLFRARSRFAGSILKALPMVQEADSAEFSIFKRIIHREVNAIMDEWTGGRLDEDADAEDEEFGSTTSRAATVEAATVAATKAAALENLTGADDGFVMLAESLKQIIALAAPGSTALADEAARTTAILYHYRGLESKPAPELFAPTRPNPIFNVLLTAVATGQPTNPRRLGAALDTLASAFEAAWVASVGRLVSEVEGAVGPVAKAIEREMGIWTRRRDWAAVVAAECKTRYEDLRQDVVKAVLDTKETAGAATAAVGAVAAPAATVAGKGAAKMVAREDTLTRKKTLATSTKRLSRVSTSMGGVTLADFTASPTTANRLDKGPGFLPGGFREEGNVSRVAGPSEVLKLPFVWEGATIIMSSQLLDEVTGSLPSDAWDWGPTEGENSSIASTGYGAKIDDLLDKGVLSYSSLGPANSQALGYWRQAQKLAESSGDLVREANALSNLGCASRMQGNFQASLSYLTSAWQKTCLYVTSVAMVLPADTEAVRIVLGSLKTDVVSIEAGARTASGGKISPSAMVTSASNLAHAKGPSILVWLMRLLINMGHAHLTIGKVSVAGKWYDGCIRLCEALLAARPIPEGTSTSSSNPRRSRSLLKRSASTLKRMGPKLSYMHRSTLLSFVRALTHRGLCYATSGSMDEAIRCQTDGLALLHKHGARIGEPETTYRAAIEANLGNIHYSRGRLTAAISHHARAAMLFLQVDNQEAHSRELGNLGALWVEVGKTLRNLQWMREANPSFSQMLDTGDKDALKAFGVSGGSASSLSGGRPGGPRKQQRAVDPAEVEQNPGKVYRVGTPYSSRDSDLAVNLKVGDRVTVFLVMDDKKTVLGQTGSGLQGTFPISCLVQDVDDEGGSVPALTSTGPAPSGFQAEFESYKELMDRYEMLTQTFPPGTDLAQLGGDGDEDVHCGTPYVEFGLGMLRDVFRLGEETNEVALNIAVGEVMLNQPYRAIASLLKLVEGPRGSSRKIPSALQKHAALTLASAFLILALANEDESGVSLYHTDGSDRFAGRGSVDSRRLNVLLSALNVPTRVQEIEKITRDDVFPLLTSLRGATSSSSADFAAGTTFGAGSAIGGTGSSPMDAVASCILGMMEWITGLWSRELDPDGAVGWMERGSRKVAEAVDKHTIAVKLIAMDESARGRKAGYGIDDPNIKGDASVFNIAAGLRYLEASLNAVNEKPVGRSNSVSSTKSTSSTTSAGASRSQLLVWSWAVNNARLQVCSKCSPKSLRISVSGDLSANVTEQNDAFPCEHLRASASADPTPLSIPAASTAAIPEKNAAGAGADADQDIVAEAAEEVVSKMIRRVSAGRYNQARNEKTGLPAPNVDRRSSIRKEPLWKYEPESKTPEEGDDMVEILKFALKGLEESARKESGDKGRLGRMSTPSWVNLFYKDAAAALRNLTAGRDVKGVLENVSEEYEEEEEEESLPMYNPSEAIMVSGV